MTPKEKTMRIALVGNPNCGKTSLFNALTGGHQKVANYPGVTVERKEGKAVTPQGHLLKILDLPGTYSLRARSPDEEIARDVVLGKMHGEPAPELILCIADASNLRLSLRLVLELQAVGRPVILVLNMFDIAKKRGIEIDLDKLSSTLCLPVVASIAVRKGGTKDLLSCIDREIENPRIAFQTASKWQPSSRDELCGLQCEADKILADAIKLPHAPDATTARADAVLLHPVWGLLILFGVLFFMFQAVFTWSGPPMEAIEAGIALLAQTAAAHIPEGLFQSFVCDGLINGVGAVLVFLPQILILFLFILLLEDFGYMARAAFLMDKIMEGSGLHGRAFIPLLSSFACTIPAIMATRVIDNRRDRLTTILVAPLMTCSARIPVYTMIISAFVPSRHLWGGVELQGLVMFGLYAMGILSALAVSFILRRIVWRRIPSDPFLMELPDYKRPNIRNVLLGLWQRAAIFVRRAGTVIAAMMVVIWFLASFPRPPEAAQQPAIHYSYAATLGKAMEPFFAPIGFNWEINIALIPSMAAREIAVATLATVYSIEESDSAEDRLGQVLTREWSLATALSFLVWFVFAPQCISTFIAIRRETGTLKWMAFSFAYTFALAYGASFATYRLASTLWATGL